MVDRSSLLESVSIIDAVSFNDGDAAIGVHDPSRVLSADGMIHIVEGSGELEYFNTNRDDHPTIVRALSDHANPKRKDEMPEYENILFNPITRSLEE